MVFNVTQPGESGGGGGGGSYTGGNGISVAGGTITNTGTIVQPAFAGAMATSGISLYAATANNPTGAAQGAAVNLYAGGATGASGAGVYAGGQTISAGQATDGTKTVDQSYIFFTGGGIYTSGTAFAGGVQFRGGAIVNDATGDIPGYIKFTGGQGYDADGGLASIYGGNSTNAKGGDAIVASGTGGTENGVILLNNRGTIGTDPHVLNADWVKSVAAVGYVVMRSQG